jgi:hypothetical protein
VKPQKEDDRRRRKKCIEPDRRQNEMGLGSPFLGAPSGSRIDDPEIAEKRTTGLNLGIFSRNDTRAPTESSLVVWFDGSMQLLYYGQP